MSPSPHTRGTPAWVVPTVVGVVAIALIAFVVGSNAAGADRETAVVEPSTATASGNPSPQVTPADGPPTEVEGPAEVSFAGAERRDPEDVLAIGAVDAPVVMVVFSDYQCQFCARWSAETLPVMMEYVDNGDLRIEWRDVNVYGRDSERAARAAYAAGLQGQFWEYHHELYADGKHRSPGDLTEDALVSLAERLSLDVQRFTSDMADDATAAEVTRNQELGIGLGAFSTPTFVMGGEPMVGAQPTPVFVEAFERALAEATG
ncbi:thioredoxin domain-containing protein [Demequina sp.]|uniref:DsbA family protein n=1 Tax=Demequina sp. TaxID=2050685 RepID=UPI0025BA9EC0|nr:thioredoxin domain-containing protein [Demequina sp.]